MPGTGCLVVVVLLNLLACRAQAGKFSWSAPRPVGSVVTTLDLPGTIVGAEVFGSGGQVVLLPDNTSVDFKSDGSVATVINAVAAAGPGTSDGAFAGKTGNSEFDAVLNQYSYDGGAKTITLYNLQVGRVYSVQLFALDDRANGGQTARASSFQDPDDPADTSAQFKMGANCYVLGTFVAPDTGDGSHTANVVIRQNLPDNGNGNINAVVIRDLGPDQPPRITRQPQSTIAYAGGGAKYTAVAIARAPECYWQMKAAGRDEFLNLHEGARFLGVRTPQLQVKNLHATDSGDYRLVFLNGNSLLTSHPASLTVLPIPALPPSNHYAEAVLASHPLAYWTLNEAASNLPIYDFAGGCHLLNHGILPGRPGLRSPAYPGFASNNLAAFFDGQNSGAASGVSLMNNLTNFTVMGWFNAAGRQNGSRVGLFGQNDAFELGYNDRQGINLFLQVSGSKEWFFMATGTNGLSPGKWCCVAVTADGTNVDIYVNGNQRVHQADCGASTGNSSYGFNVGGDGILDPTGNCFYGAIEDVAIFGRALAPESIQKLYQSAAGRVAPVVLLQPQSAARYLGAWVQFSVLAEGATPLSYQWQMWTGDHGGFADLQNGGGYDGVTSSGLNITNLTLNHVGNYRVRVSNPAGSTTSAALTLTALSGTPKIIWSRPTTITTAAATLGLPGTVIGAEVFGGMAKTIVQGGITIVFETNGSLASVSNGSRIWSGPETGIGAFKETTGNQDFDAILNQFDHDGGPKTITLHKLVVGRRYAVQLFALDDRLGATATRQANFQSAADGHDISANFTMSCNAYVVGTFTAASEEIMIQENLPTFKQGNLNALIVRDLGVVAGP